VTVSRTSDDCAACSVFDRFRAIAHEGEVDKRVQFTIEELYRVRARGFEAEGFAAVLPALDLVRVAHSTETEAGVGHPCAFWVLDVV